MRQARHLSEEQNLMQCQKNSIKKLKNTVTFFKNQNECKKLWTKDKAFKWRQNQNDWLFLLPQAVVWLGLALYYGGCRGTEKSRHVIQLVRCWGEFILLCTSLPNFALRNWQMLKFRAFSSLSREQVVKYLPVHCYIQPALGWERAFKKIFLEKEIPSKFCRIRIWKGKERTSL